MKLGWVDFSPEDRKRAIEALDSLRERGAVDELGIGAVRDAFADAFFPGTSTLQTRAKYFVLVPCAVRMTLEKMSESPARRDGPGELRRIERECARQMWENCGGDESAGVIGRRNLGRSEWVLRPPSEIYWAGLRTFGISSVASSVGTWIGRTSRLAREAGWPPDRFGGDDEEGISDDADTRLVEWKEAFDLPRDVFRSFSEAYRAKTLSPDLTQREAAFLAGKLLGSGKTKGSVLGTCLEKGIVPPKPDPASDETPSGEERSPFFRFARSIRGFVSGETAVLLDQACAFNRLVFAARVLYNKRLAVPDSGAESVWKEIRPSVPGWMTADLPSVFRRFGIPRTGSLGTFLESLQRAFRERDFDKAEELMLKRECRIKGENRAKLLHPGNIDPGKWIGGGWLDFRLANAIRILADIADAKGGGRA